MCHTGLVPSIQEVDMGFEQGVCGGGEELALSAAVILDPRLAEIWQLVWGCAARMGNRDGAPSSLEALGAASPIEYGSAGAPPRAMFRVPQAGQTNSPGLGISSSDRHRPHRTITAPCYRSPGGAFVGEQGRTLRP
jgi:hypothetical protein